MVWKKSWLGFATVSVALPLGFAVSPMALSNTLTKESAHSSWEISQAFQSPNRNAPPGAAGGGTRGGACLLEDGKQQAAFVPLIPKGQVGLTLSEYPTFLIYVPEGPKREVSLMLLHRDGEREREVASVIFTSPGQPGIISVSLPKTPENKLKVDQLYRWEMEVVCDPSDPSGNMSVDGWIQLVPRNGVLANLGVNSTPADYAKNGIWYEAVASAAKLRRDKPNDPKVRTDWERLLNSVGLNTVVTASFVDCCTVEQNN
jgi:Domain of Unknown Function (DUF928)